MDPDAGTIAAQSGMDITIAIAADKPDGFYNGGMLIQGTTYKYISAHVGSLITLGRLFNPLVIGSSAQLVAGCDRTMDDCLDKFDNLDNFGGFPFIPTINPFGGTSLA
jgi:hypothetical protein